jgi:hypothetical protein
MDERSFIYGEEPDLCLRMKKAGWEIRHLPHMKILHHAGKAGRNPRVTAQEVFARKQLARKQFSPTHRVAYTAALGLGLCLRAVVPSPQGGDSSGRSKAARAGLRVLLGMDGSPYGEPPGQAVQVREHDPVELEGRASAEQRFS